MTQRRIQEKLECPHCGHLRSRVIWRRITQRATHAYRRIRRCLACERQFSTTETIDAAHSVDNSTK